MTRRTHTCERREERDRQTCGRDTRVRDEKRDTRAKRRVMNRERQTKHTRGTEKKIS